MIRLLVTLLAAAVLATACAGDSSSPTGDQKGIAALEEAPGDGAVESKKKRAATNGDGDKASKATDGSKTAGGQDGGRSAAASGDSSDTRTRSATRSGGSGERIAPPTPIPTGTYGYATDGQTTISGNTYDMPERTTLTAQEPQGQLQVQIRDLRDRDGNGTLTENRLLYRNDGVYLTYVKVTSRFPGGLTDVREFRPNQPELIAPADGRPGFQRSFTMQGSGTRADVILRALRFEKVSAGGSERTAIVVSTRIEFSGSLEGEQEATSWFFPKHVLLLKEKVRTDVRNGPLRLQSNYEAILE